MAKDKVSNLYNAFVKDGYAMESEEQFRENLKDPKKRKAAYDALVADGYSMEPYADFESNIGFGASKPQATTAAPAPASTPAPTAQAPTQSAPAPTPQQPKQPAWQPTEQDKIRMSYQIHTMLNDFNQKSKARIAQVQRMAEPFTPEGRKKRAAKKFQAQLAGTKTTAGIGLKAPSSPIYDGGSPQPYGVEYVDGKPVTQWLMPDGSLTTSQFAADRAEDTARKNRLRHQFENRMKQNGLDPAKPEDVEMQAQYDAQAPAYDAVAELWQEAEEKHKADKERNADREWDRYAAMGGGRELRIVTTSMNRHADNISHMTRFDLQKMMDNAWARAGSKVTANCYNRLRQQYPDASDEELQTAASQMARQLTDNAVYQYAVQQNTPKSTLEYFGRTVANMNVINSISKGLARSQAGTSGDLAAYEAAMGEYGKNHRVAQIAGTVTGMAVDPVTWVSGGVGSLAGKGAINIGGRIVAGRAATSMSTQVGSRIFSSSLTGRIITGAAAGGGNFATYEMLKEGESQFLHGGHINSETGENEGYSAGAVLSAGGHGLVLGSVTGTLSPMIGNVADKTVKTTTSTAGKAGVRLSEVAVSTLAEGTIFSVPEWINGDADAMDVWTDNMAMMLGFKAQHGLKSAPRVIASLRPVKPVGGRPLTQAERNHNRMDFEERLRRNLDASPSDLSFTADEREELRRAGYGELADLFSRDRVQEVQRPDVNPAGGAIELRTERVEAETISRNPEFDGYSVMEELMQDGRVSQVARAKAYYVLTGRMLPMGTITGYTTTKSEDGRVTVNATTADGEVVTSRTFKNEQAAKQETDNIMRQAELNSVDVGERYKEAVADDMVLDAAISEVSPGADPATIKRIYRAVKAGNKDVTESQKQLVEFLDDAIERNRDIADRYRPEAIREALKDETGIDVDAVLRKMPSKRTKAEQDAVKTYLERLFPEEARQQAAEPTAEQEEAQNQYQQGRELYGRFEEGDPTAQADVDAIALRMQEAYQAVEDAFGAEAEYYMFHVNENPWALVNDPELTIEQQDAVLYYINAKAALDGVMDASNEAADRKRAEVEQSVEKRTHKDNGMVIPATMKVDDRQVYIVKGDVVMFPDGSAVDVRNSSESVVVMDAQTGEYEFTSPDQIFKVSDSVNPQDEVRAAHAVIEQEQMGVFGENAVAPEAPMEESADVAAGEQPTTDETPAPASTEDYDRGYEHGLAEAAKADDAWIANYIKIRSQNTPESMSDSMKGELDAYIYEQQRRAQAVPKTPENVPNTTENPVLEGEIASEAVSSVENGQQTALSRISLNEQGEPRFETVDKDTAWDGLVEAVGGDANAVSIATAQVQQATADLEALKKKQPTQKAPKLKGSPMSMKKAIDDAEQQYQSELADYNQQVADTQARLDAWNAILGVNTSRNAELRRQREEERRQRDAIAHDAAVARFEEEQRIKAEKQAEQERIGVHAVNPKIKEKWDAAPKVEGNEDALTLPDGSTISGRYVLTEAGPASPSHDANNAYMPTEGFPIDENGQSVNDRDYMRDKDAQQIVEGMAGNYDNRALQDPVIVSKDGVVLSGNNRTMSGDLAARRGTDKAYVDYLAQFGHRKYGFTPEQVAGMKNPRVVFVPDEALPYDATTFARFNAQEKKSQGKPEAAVKLGKIVPDNVFNNIVGDISRYDRLSDYYADEKAVAHALGALMQAGVINDKQMPEMRTGTALSAAGKELIENTLIGKVFQASPDAVRQIISVPTLRQSIVMGLSEIANNRTLASKGYDISEELSKAVDLVARAKTAMPDIYKDGMPVSPFGRMQGLFDDEFGDSRVTDGTALLLADILNSGKPSDLRKVLSSYNNEAAQAAGGQIDIFSGKIPTKEEILTNVNEHFRNATPKEQQALVDAAIAERKRRAEADAEQRERSEASEQTPHDAQRSAEPQQPTADGDTELEPLGKDRNDFYEDTPEEAALRARISVGEEWEEEGPAPDKPIYKRKLYVDGKHEVIQTDAPDKNGSYTGSQLTFDGRDFGDLKEIADYIDNSQKVSASSQGSVADYIDGGMQAQQAEPTEAQKAAGNYKMEHRRVDGYNISIENAKGSVRRGTGADGKPWETVMQNDYGYIRGTEGVDGDHIDVFLSDTPEEGDMFVVDQVNDDGSFDEHKVMYGFPTVEAARDAYLSNYEPGWTGLGAITHVNKDEFKKWIQSSRRKTKPFAEYKSVKPIEENGMIGRSLTEQEATELIKRMEASAEVAPTIELTPENWIAQFGEDGTVETPIGIVKMGENQYFKMARQGREGKLGMVKPTLQNPDVIVEDYRPASVGASERDTSYIFVKTFDKEDGSRYYYFTSVTVRKDGREVVISNQERSDKRISKLLQQGKVAWIDNGILHPKAQVGKSVSLNDSSNPTSSDNETAMLGVNSSANNESLSPGSEWSLTEAPSESEGPDLVPTSDNISSDGKVNTLSADKQADGAESSEPYTITPTTYTNKKGKTSNVFLVKFNRELTAEEKAALNTFIREPLAEGKKTQRGWYGREQGGYMMRSEEAARQLAEMIDNEEAVADAQPMTAEELREAVTPAPAKSEEKKPAKKSTKPKKAPINRVSLEDVMTDLSEKGETMLSDHAEPVKTEPEAQHEISDDEMQSLANELRDLLGIGEDEGDNNIKFRDPGELTPQERQRIQSAGIRMAMGLVERGTTTFPDFATKMVGLLGDKIRPWLKSFYEGARWTPGYEKYAFTPSAEVATFDVQNFDKKQADPIAQAAMIVEERKAADASAQAQRELTETRNKQRKEHEQQTEADTAALAEKAEAVAGEAESTAKSAGTGEAGRKSILRDLKRVDDTLEEVNDQLALLGYYEADPDAPEHEVYGQRRSAEKKAVKDATRLAKQLVSDLGLGLDKVTSATTENRSKKSTAVAANVAPAGGDININLPYPDGRNLHINIGLSPTHERGVEPKRGGGAWEGDNYEVDRILFRIDEDGRMGDNHFFPTDVTYSRMRTEIERVANRGRKNAEAVAPTFEDAPKPLMATFPDAKDKDAVDKWLYDNSAKIWEGVDAIMLDARHDENLLNTFRADNADESVKSTSVGTFVDKWLTDRVDAMLEEHPETVKAWYDYGQRFLMQDVISERMENIVADEKAKSKAEVTHNGYKVGDEVMWDPYGNGKWEKVKIEDFDTDGNPIFEAVKGVMSEKGNWERIKPVDGIFGEAKRIARKAAEERKATQNAVNLLRDGNKPAKKSVSSQKKTTVKPEQPVADLFGGLFDEPINPSDNERTEVGTRPGETGGQRQQLKQDTQVGGDESRRETERPARTASSGSTGVDTDADRKRGRRVSRVVKDAALSPVSESERKNVHNNHVERGTETAPKSVDARIKANIEAIDTMKRLRASGEDASEEDMKKLRAFSGWGGLGKAFSDWTTQRRLKELIGEKQFEEDAQLSRNSAYFTPAYVVDTMWDIARALGFKGGRILEGSAGVGNVLGLMPRDFSERSSIHAVEKDPTTGGMLTLLYPDANVDVKGFEETKIDNGSIDLAITNVPFVPGLHVKDSTGDRDLSHRFKDIHNFCIAKNVRKLRDGGIGIFITTAGTLDSTGKLFKWLTTEGNSDIVGLFRMHNETFGGTNATSDIIVVRKRIGGVKSPYAIDASHTTGVRVADYDTGDVRKKTIDGVKVTVPVINHLSMSYNRYFVEHPEHMAGDMKFGFETGDTYRPKGKSLYPSKDKDQGEMLIAWVAEMQEKEFDDVEEQQPSTNYREAYVPTYDKVGNEVKTGTVVIDSNGRICVNYDGQARPLMSDFNTKNPKSEVERIAQFNKNKVKGKTRPQVVADYNAIKKALADVLEYEKSNESDAGLQPYLDALNKAFDNFVATYGHLHGNNGLAWLKNDVDYPSVLALETYREDGLEHTKVFSKADIFNRRVVTRVEQPKPANVKDGVILSIRQNGKLDVAYIAEQLGMSEDRVRQQIIEAGLGYENPLTHGMEASHEYLSGNVREKLRQAEENNEDGRYAPNIAALRKVVPHDIPSHFIEFSIGSSWIRPELYEEYIKERTGADVKLTYAVGMWTMEKPKRWNITEQDKSFGVKSDICNKIIPGHELMEAAMTNKTIRVSSVEKSYDGDKTINDPVATSACAAKVDEIRDDFKSWLRNRMTENPELAKEIEETYNNIFNNSAPMTIPDEYIPEYFDGAARVIGGKPIKLRSHQAKAVVRGTMQSLMLAHEVGTGKTFTLITTAMEMRRLGAAQKPMIVVQNATLGQFVASAKALYPDARILSLEDRDRNAQGRKDFYAKIRYNDWDMVVIPQSVLEKIPDHPDRERQFIEESIEEKMEVIEAMQSDRENSRMVSDLKKEVEKMQDRLAALDGEANESAATTKKKDGKKAAVTRENARTKAEEMLDRATDDTLNFDDLGVDAILVDEAHEYKHLGFATAMQRGIKGVDPSYSKKCQGLFLKVKAVQEMNAGRNVIFATGTPISNTAAEIWTFMRYLLPRETMEEHNIWHFDDFVRNFGSIQQMLEFTTAGKYKENNRFAGYTNLPELARIWAGVADTVLTAEAGEVKSQIPELEGGKPTDIYLPQTSGLRAVIKYVKKQLEIFENMTGQEKKENSHIPLTMYGIAKAAAIDARLVMVNAPDDKHSKTNECVRQTLRSLKDSEAYKGTVAIFADNYQRKNKTTGIVEFNLFEDIRDKLIAAGVPAEQIMVMRDGLTDKKKEQIFAKVNAGEIRVILGTTPRLGVGVNIQERLHTLMHLDAPNRPMDYWQRMGRLLRQGNLHKEMGIPVRVIRFGVEDSLDVTAYQRLKTKGAIADAVMNSKALLANNLENRVLEEEGDEFGNITAELSGSEYAILQNQTEKELRKLLAKQDQHRQHQLYIHRTEPRLRGQIRSAEERIEGNDKALARLAEASDRVIEVNGKKYQSIEDMEDVFKAHNKAIAERRQRAEQGETTNSVLKFSIGGIQFELRTAVQPEMDFDGGVRMMTSQLEQKLLCPELFDDEVNVQQSNFKKVTNLILDEVVSGKWFKEARENAINAKERGEADLATLLKDKGKEFEHGDRIKELQTKLVEYTEALQKDLADKEAKYAEMDAETEEADDIVFTGEDDDYEEDSQTNGDGNKYRLIEERELLDFLDGQPLKKGYRYSQWANMGVLPPMTAKQNGEWRAPMIFSRWEQSEEGMRKENGKADLVQGNGRTTGDVAYNPYFHIRTSPLNDQFTAAYDRPELLVVEGYYPESEETSGYRAEGAKDSVGLMDWHSGSVNGQLSDDTKVQTMLSRYFKPGRIVPWGEVADLIMERVGDQNITFPINAVPPMLRAELAKRGAKFGDISGSVAEADIPMLNELRDRVNAGEWDAGLEKARAYMDAYESSAEAKEARVADLCEKVNLPVRIIRTQEEVDALPTRRERRAKGWWSAKDDEVVIVLPNNVNVADVENTFVHEVAGHKGLRAFIGEERFDEFLGEVYDHASNSIRKVIDKMTDDMVNAEADRLRVRMAQAHERAGEDVNANYYPDMAKARIGADKKREQFRREATEEYMSDLGGRIGSEGFEKMSRDEQTLWGKIKAKVQTFLDKFLRGLKIAKSIRLNDKDLSYILFKSWKNMRDRKGKGGVFANAEDAVRRRQSGYDADVVTRFRDPGLGLEETITKMKAEAMQANVGNLQAKRDAMRAIGGNLNHLRQAMARQREYDITTAKSIKDLARILMENGLLDTLGNAEVKSLLAQVTNSIGRQDISKQVDRVFEIMVNNHLRNTELAFGKLISMRTSRVDGRGIQVQGDLDPDGQAMLKVFNKWKGLTVDEIDRRISDAIDAMSDSYAPITERATLEYAGLQLAREYAENVAGSKSSEKMLREDVKRAKEEKDAGRMTSDAYKQFEDATRATITQMKLDRISALESLTEKLGGELAESVERAKAWREAEKNRVNRIHHLANSDMQGRELRGDHEDTRLMKLRNHWSFSWLLEPMSTLDQMLKMFGRQNPNGEGYMQNYFMRGWVDAADSEQIMKESAHKQMDDKAAEIFGQHRVWYNGGAKKVDYTYSDIYGYAKALPGATITYYDGADMREYEIGQGELLYLYAVDKMPMGRATNRRMGIDEATMQNITNALDSKLKEYADWVQEELLPQLGDSANEVHKRMFGANMDAIENYFPFVRDKDALKREVENGQSNQTNDRISVQTGAIKKRVASVSKWNMRKCNFMDVLAKHIDEMCHWTAFAELNRDFGTLLSYNRLKQQVFAMNSVYGAGDQLWKRFEECCAIATDAYDPQRAKFDRFMVQGAKGVTMGKISLRTFTALKQTLSLPAFFGEVNIKHIATDLATGGVKACQWAWKNMPNFRKRILSRTSGDYRLKENEYDGKIMKASSYGMLPNIGVDAWTIAVGSYGVYKTRKAKYLRWGMSESDADHRAIQDAELCYNKSQQSSEGPFMAPVQVDHTFYATSAMLFRNSSTSYTREAHASARNLKRLISGEVNEDFVAKQILRTLYPENEGAWTDEQWAKARKNAKREIHSAYVKNSVNLAMFGWILPWLWRIGGVSPLLLLSGDDDENNKQWEDATRQSIFAPIEGLAYGDVISDGFNMLTGANEKSIYNLGRSNPIISDILQAIKKADKDQMAAANDVINILGGMAIGINPQTITDWATAIIDYNSDVQTQHECALLVARLLSCPPSQLEKVYFEELDMDALEASKLTPNQLASRYAEYKMMREAPLTGWMRSTEASDSIKSAKAKRVLNNAKDRIDSQSNERSNVNASWLSDYETVKSRLSKIRKVKEEDEDRYYELLDELEASPVYDRYLIIKDYKHDIEELSKSILRAKSAQERQQLTDSLIALKRDMVKDLKQTQQ